MASLVGQEVAGKEVDSLAALVAINHLYPQKILYRNIGVSVVRAIGALRSPYFLLKEGQ